MASIADTIFYILLFFSVYVQVFFLVTLLENRKKIEIRKEKIKLKHYPAVTIVVPCWNEESTVYKTVRSLLALNYPKNKLKIFLVDDGSTDNTWGVISSFAKYSNIRVFRKENGGKHAALNLGLEHADTPFFGCLDADSFAHPESLVRIMSFFERDSFIMAVAPSVTVADPDNYIGHAQRAEYFMGVYIKKMLGFLGAINVTPGPLTIFRKKVFDDLGPYRKAYNTEDMEIAYRMQKHHYKIEHCPDAYVYTNIPKTIKKLFKQRLRWIYGFINNTLDYKEVLFRKKYGNFSLFTLPTGIVSIASIGYLFWKIIYQIVDFTYSLFFINTPSSIFLVMLIYGLVVVSMLFGRWMVEGNWRPSFNMVFYFLVFTALAPVWIMKAVYQTVIGRAPNWR